MSEPAGSLEFRRLHPLTPLARGWTVVAVVGAVVVTQFLGDAESGASWWVWILVASLPVALAYGFASWLFTRYAIVGGDLRVETGLVFKRSRVIDLDRLESVDVVQPLVPRVLGLAELRLEVAGGSSTEAPLAYLSLADARTLKAALLALRVGTPTRETEPEERILLKVPVDRLIVSALLSGAWVASAFAAGFFLLDTLLGGEAVLGLFLPAVFGIVRGIRTFLADYDFTVAESTDGLHIRRGLLDTRSQTVTPGRIQAIRVTRPLLWRPFGWVKVHVNVAGYAPTRDGQIATTSTLLPVAPDAEAQWLLTHLLPGLDLGAVGLVPPPRRARWIWLVTYSGLGIGMTDEFVVSRERLMGRHLSTIPLSKPQSVRLTEGPLQRRLGLATVHIDTTPGPVRVRLPERATTEARWLFDTVVARLAERLPRRPPSDDAEALGEAAAPGDGEQGGERVRTEAGDTRGDDQ
ncbi:MAG: PH domain-containing protein [Acidimicrobiales bacterium]